MRRPHLLLIAAFALLPLIGSCRRRVPGTCNDHIDCDPGFDCIERRCTRRASVHGGGGMPSVRGIDAEASDPAQPAPASGEDPAAAPPASAPPKKAAPPVRPPPPGSPPGLEQPAPAPGQREPMWKLRRKNA